jgi:NADH-quinone oxidoreductase subunit C
VGAVLARRDRALTPEDQLALLTDRLGDDAVVTSATEFATFTVHVAPERWADAVARCRDEADLAYDMFDCLFGIDAREDGFDVVCVLYATSMGNRIALRTRCPGGRQAPTLATVTHLFRGADWMERETWDMFGIEFEGHPGLAPRLLTVENFEGWPLRKDFYLASRAVKPWPGVKEPAELDEDGNVIDREPRLGDAPGPHELDKAMAEQAKLANPLPAAVTEQGDEAEAGAHTADVAVDSGQVVAGDEEQATELAEEERSDRDVAAGEASESADEVDAAAAAERQTAAEERGAAETGGPTSTEPQTGGTASGEGGRAERVDDPPATDAGRGPDDTPADTRDASASGSGHGDVAAGTGDDDITSDDDAATPDDDEERT